MLTASASKEEVKVLESAGVPIRALRIGLPSIVRQQMEIMRPSGLLNRLATECTRDGKPDWTVVISDELVSLGRYLGKTQRNAYVSNGDFAVLFFNEAFYGDGRIRKGIASTLTSYKIRRHAADARLYDLLLANSEFTRNFMSYLYALPFGGVCYPPVDPLVFHPSAPKATPGFALAMARNLHEQGIQTLERLARAVPLKVVGGMTINGAESLGIVDDAELSRQYSAAAVVVSPIVSEFFGYSVAEALSCGTPVVCYSVCGPGELVKSGFNGWAVDSPSALIERTSALVSQPFEELRSRAIAEAAMRFQDVEVARDFLLVLKGQVRTGSKS